MSRLGHWARRYIICSAAIVAVVWLGQDSLKEPDQLRVDFNFSFSFFQTGCHVGERNPRR